VTAMKRLEALNNVPGTFKSACMQVRVKVFVELYNNMLIIG
jgi:hypothetical protein